MSKSRKRNVNNARQSSTSSPSAVDRMRIAKDSYSNSLARLGAGQLNLASFSEYPITRLTQNYALMNSLYRNDWIAGRIIDTVPEDMCKNWYKLTSNLTPDQIKGFSRVERRSGVRRSILEGLKWGRLYGGTAGVMMVSGQEDMLSEPLDLGMIMPGQFKGIIIADRWNGVYPSIELVDDLDDPDFGLPEYYTFSIDSNALTSGIRVHHSRVLRFVGRELPYIERMAETYWGMSELEHIYEELNKRNSTSANIAQLIFQSNIRVLKMEDFGQLLTSTSPEIQRDLYQTIQAQNMMMNNMGIQLLSREDSFENHASSFSGLSELYEMFMMDISGASEIPVTKLYGRSPAGMNSTGEGDLTNYYDTIHQRQESSLRPVLDKVIPVLSMSTWGAIPDDLEYEFESIRDSSDEERANIIQQTTNAINTAYTSDIINQRIALQELQKTSSSTGMWTSITDEDIENADTGFTFRGEVDIPNPEAPSPPENTDADDGW